MNVFTTYISLLHKYLPYVAVCQKKWWVYELKKNELGPGPDLAWTWPNPIGPGPVRSRSRSGYWSWRARSRSGQTWPRLDFGQSSQDPRSLSYNAWGEDCRLPHSATKLISYSRIRSDYDYISKINTTLFFKMFFSRASRKITSSNSREGSKWKTLYLVGARCTSRVLLSSSLMLAPFSDNSRFLLAGASSIKSPVTLSIIFQRWTTLSNQNSKRGQALPKDECRAV